MPDFTYPAMALTDTRQRNDFVLGQFRGQLWVGVRFGNEWRPARTANSSDIKYFN